MRVEIKHHRLFHEPILSVNLCCNLIKILVYRLLNIQAAVFDQVDVVLDVLQRVHSLFHLPVAPDVLDAVGGSFLDDFINWKLWSASSPLISLEAVFNS